jgi:cytochrome P450
MIDPPEHARWRKLLTPAFSPGRAKNLEPRMHELAEELVSKIARQGGIDYVSAFGRIFPATVFLEVMALPQADLPLFNKWEAAILHTSPEVDPGRANAIRCQQEVQAYFQDLILERRRNLGEDVISDILRASDDFVTDEALLSICLMLFLAGLDTVGAHLAYAMYHLATHIEDRRRLVAEPEIVDSATEELLRMYSIVLNGRRLTRDLEFGGCLMRKGDTVMMPFVLANRENTGREQGDQVILDRAPNRHLSFGVGIHRCLGAHLARREMKAALTAWHAAIPEYRLDSTMPALEHGLLLGLDSLSLTWKS